MTLFRSLLAAAVTAAAALAQSAPCFETSLGTNLALGDDQVSYNNALGFNFSGLGGTFSAIDISSNGFIYLGTNTSHGSNCCSGYDITFLTGDPMIAGYWMDLYPPGSTTGGVFFNTFPASPGVPARAVITWYQVPEYFSNPAITAQIQLLDTGEIFIHHDINNPVSQAYHTPLVGVTQGLNATANIVDFASIGPAGVNTGTNPTAYQWYQFPPTYDLMGYTSWFIPNGTGGYVITSVCPPPARAAYTTIGLGCPNPPVVYELFTSGTCDLSNQSMLFQPNGAGGWVVIPGSNTWFSGFTNNLNLTDDSVAQGLALPFAFNHPAGTVTSIDVSSNGFLWLASNTNSACCTGNVAGFLADLPRIAPLWMDLNPSSGGAVYADADPSGQAYYVTWSAVPEFGNAATIVTMQVALFANGGFELRYQTVGNGSHDALTGYTTGNGAVDPGNRDLTAAIPFSTGTGGIPLGLNTTVSGDRPILGTTFNQDIVNVPASSPLAFLFLGFTSYGPTGIDLTAVGMPGCFQWNSLSSTLVYLASGPTVTAAITVPNNPSLGGLFLHNQAAALAPGLNALGVIASNGATLRLGM